MHATRNNKVPRVALLIYIKYITYIGQIPIGDKPSRNPAGVSWVAVILMLLLLSAVPYSRPASEWEALPEAM